MKFSLEATKRAAKQTGSMDLIEATEGLTSAWESLTAAQRGMEEVCDVMDNIQMSIEHLNKFGDKSVKILNADKSLESFLQLPEKLITADKAQEGLGDAAKKAWETLVEWCTKIWEAIANFCKKIIGFFTSKSDTNEKKIKEIKEKVKKGKKKQPGPVREGGVGGMRDPGEEGLKASLEAKATLADGSKMEYWQIGKYDTADKTIVLLARVLPIAIRESATALTLFAQRIGVTPGHTDIEQLKADYDKAFETIAYPFKNDHGNTFAMQQKLEIPAKHGLSDHTINSFTSKFSAPSNQKDPAAAGWNEGSLSAFLDRLEACSKNKAVLVNKVENAQKSANAISGALSRYIKNTDGKLSSTRIYLQASTTAAQNLMKVINEAMKAYVSIETGLTKVADHASKALGF